MFGSSGGPAQTYLYPPPPLPIALPRDWGPFPGPLPRLICIWEEEECTFGSERGTLAWGLAMGA